MEDTSSNKAALNADVSKLLHPVFLTICIIYNTEQNILCVDIFCVRLIFLSLFSENSYFVLPYLRGR